MFLPISAIAEIYLDGIFITPTLTLEKFILMAIKFISETGFERDQLLLFVGHHKYYFLEHARYVG